MMMGFKLVTNNSNIVGELFSLVVVTEAHQINKDIWLIGF